MTPRRSKAALAAVAAGIAGLALAIPALGQNGPESLLPPGFGESAAPPPPAPGTGEDTIAPLPLIPPGGVLPSALTPEEQAAADAEAQEAAEQADIPDAARRSIDLVGPLGPDEGGLGEGAFGRADGRFLTRLMVRLDAPIASRWASILLRRALLSRVPTPRSTQPASWIAERAWLLLRMGEADGARMLVESVDTDRYTPRFYAVAAQSALANSDPAALCPIADAGEATSAEPLWPLARAICAGLSGDAGTSSALIDRVRSKRLAGGIDLLLAEKTVGAGTNSRRAVNIEWTAVDKLTSWRFGLATALGLPIPAALYPTAGPQVAAWRSRAPMFAAEQRIAFSRAAAALGPLSSSALVDLYGAVADATDPSALAGTPAARLRTAYVAEEQSDRMTALRSLWTDPGSPRDRYAGAILTARAAARITPDADYSADAAALIAAMMSAGLDRQAARWGNVVQSMGSAGDDAWALLAVGAPRQVVPISAGRVSGLADRRHAQLLFAGLAGLGRLPSREAARLADQLDVPIGRENHWIRAISGSARVGASGTVALLAAVGLQAREWRGIPAEHLYHIIAALKQTGQEPIARMIAAEALSRS